MPRHALLITLCLGVLSSALMGADWLRLNDGKIVALLKRQGDEARIQRADGSKATIPWSDVDGVLKASQAEHEVVQALQRLRTRPDDHAKTGERLTKIGAAAVPTLLTQWKQAKTGYERALVMACLQYVWAKPAKEVLMAGLEDEDEQVRRLAKVVLERQLPVKQRSEIYELLKHHNDPALAGPSLKQRLLVEPDRDALLEAVNSVTLRSYVHTLVPRYHELIYEEPALRLLRVGSEIERSSGLLGLIVQWNAHPKVRIAVSGALADDSALIRDLAAEYLRRLGTSEDMALLQERVAIEQDGHTKASLTAAMNAIQYREKSLANLPERQATFVAESPKVLSQARDWFTRFPSQQGRQQLIVLSRAAVSMAPYFTIMSDHDLTKVIDSERPPFPWTSEIAGHYGQLLTSLAHMPPGERAESVPPAKSLVAPVRDYFDETRKSFGHFVDPDKYPGNPFANSVHVGDDVAWRRQGATVVAIGDGIVRLARPASGGSWGGFVAIEHRTPTGDPFCTVYGHLGLVLNVRFGDVVRAEQKIGTVGRDWTRDNGGFLSHLHFGLFEGPYSGRVTSGYASRAGFNRGNKRGWTDPQAFIRHYPSATGS